MNKDIVFLKIASHISEFSKCVSHKVGCLIVKDDRILSTGYNGTPKGFVNCCDKFPNYNIEQRPQHNAWSTSHEIHAEMNSIIWAARNGIIIDGSTIYSTLQPCIECSKNIAQAGIKCIVFRHNYDKIGDNLNIILNMMNTLSIEYLHIP